LIEIKNMTNKDRKNISKEKKKEFTLFDDIFDLWFDKFPNNEDEVIERDSRPFSDGGITYYTLNRKLILDE